MVASLQSCGTASESQADLKSSVNLSMRFGQLSMYSSPGMALDPGALPVERGLTALLTSSTVEELASLALITTCGRWAMACAVMEEGQLSTLLKCSAHLPRSLTLSVSKVEPSALSIGDDPDDWGP